MKPLTVRLKHKTRRKRGNESLCSGIALLYIHTPKMFQSEGNQTTYKSQRNSCWDHFGEWYFYIIVSKLFVGLLCELRKGRIVSETEIETYNVLVAAS